MRKIKSSQKNVDKSLLKFLSLLLSADQEPSVPFFLKEKDWICCLSSLSAIAPHLLRLPRPCMPESLQSNLYEHAGVHSEPVISCARCCERLLAVGCLSILILCGSFQILEGACHMESILPSNCERSHPKLNRDRLERLWWLICAGLLLIGSVVKWWLSVISPMNIAGSPTLLDGLHRKLSHLNPFKSFPIETHLNQRT